MDYTIAGVEGGVCAPRGFRAAGVNAGLAGTDQPDLALVASQHTAVAAGRLTSHRFASAPVRWTRERVAGGAARAVVVHAGVANAATGAAGVEDAAGLAAAAAEALACRQTEILVLGTGKIGARLDLAAAVEGVGRAAATLSRRGSSDACGAMAAGEGVLCERAAAVAWTEGELRIGGIAKASAPFAPSFATTLAVLTTDARIEAGLLGEILSRSVRRSFERVLIDQGPGMGDAVVLLANGTAAAPPLSGGAEGAVAFEAALSQLCEALSEGLAIRMPGSRKLLAVTVHGAASHGDALSAARSVAGSVALRVALAAGVAAWPAVLDALGACEAPVDADRVSVRFGPVTVVALGRLAPHDEGAAAAVAAKAQVDVAIDLGAGSSAATVTTTDLPTLASPE